MKNMFIKEKTLHEMFNEAIYYLETHEFPTVTFCGISITSLKYVKDEAIMTQIVDIVDVLKYQELLNREAKTKVKSRTRFCRKCNKTILGKNPT